MLQMNPNPFLVKPGSQVSLADYDTRDTQTYGKKADAVEKLQASIEQLKQYQDVLYAQNTYGLLIVLQAMDAAGKDSTIKHVMSGVNPQGCNVTSFQQPSAEEGDHDYLWRIMRHLPERGNIRIFNRSHYEEVLVVRVHPEILARQQLPQKTKDNPQIWQQRFEEINNFEKYLVNNGILILKFFLHVSKAEQKKRFLERINRPEKNWKFSAKDVEERQYWDDYRRAYEAVFSHTSTKWAPWYIIPADRKWFTRLAVSSIICQTLKSLKLEYPQVSAEQKQELAAAKVMLENELE
ncbi:MAG: polyphosphate kinase 2 family protein [Leptolyngbya sp. SIO4C1]|nr:polyphosphate kinase 2 family protein [Leptolyngbya sp. SIO4C1]